MSKSLRLSPSPSPASAPTASSSRRSSHPSTSAATTPTKPAPLPRGPLTASLESTYHKRLRTILVEHKRLRKEWNEMVLRGCVGRCRVVVESWNEIENGIQQLDKRTKGLGADAVDDERGSSRGIGVRAGYLYTQSVKLSDQLGLIARLVDTLTEILNQFNQLSERAEMLVVEAAKTRGTAFAFREALWVTWPLSRFADAIQDLTSPYTPSLTLIQTLIETLTTFPVVPPPLAALRSLSQHASAAGISAASMEDNDSVAAVDSSLLEATPVLPFPASRVLLSIERPSSEVLQACISLLAAQPLLPGKSAEGGTEAWEEICNAEVGGWSS